MSREEWNARWADAEHHIHHHHGHHVGPDSLLVEVAESLPPGRAVDLGCGQGENVLWLAQHGWRVMGVDFADAALVRARQRADELGVEADWSCIDLVDWQADGVYDLIVFFYLHLEMKELQPVLQRAAEALAPGGCLLFAGHDRRDASKFEHITPEMLSTPEEISAILAPLQVDRAETIDHRAHGHDASATTVVLARRGA